MVTTDPTGKSDFGIDNNTESKIYYKYTGGTYQHPGKESGNGSVVKHEKKYF